MLIDTLKWRCWHPIPQKMEYTLGWGTAYKQEDVPYMANTGLFDANDKEIWESDIVFILTTDRTVDHLKFNYEGKCYCRRGSISYDPNHTSIRIWFNTPKDSEGEDLVCFDKEQRHVVGNIYEHPDLLTVTICTQCHTLNPKIPIAYTLTAFLCAECLKEINSKLKGDATKAFQIPTRNDFDISTMQELAKLNGTFDEGTWSYSSYYDGYCNFIWTPRNLQRVECLKVRIGQWVIREGHSWRVADEVDD